ncbi:MAG: hypothetical protein JWR69_4623 [Pedosphaera sp.]|nr:hypothetical protein [Pedosphaera sp.]
MLEPAKGDKAGLDKKYAEFVAQEKARRETYDEHVLQLTALKLVYDDLASKLSSTQTALDVASALLPEETRMLAHWQELLDPAGKDKDALEKAYKKLDKEERARPSDDADHQSRLETLKIVYGDAVRSVAAPERPAVPAKPETIWSYLHLAKSSAYADRAKPAQFGWTRTDGDDVYTAKGGITLGYFGTDPSKTTGDYVWNWWGGFDFDLSSDKKKNPGTLTQTLSAFGYSRNTGKFDEHALHLTYLPSISHLANRNFKSQNLVAQLLIEPATTFGDLPVNLRKHGVLFGPQFGAEVGQAFDKTKGKSPEDGGFSRGFMKWSLSVYPSGLNDKLYLYLDNTTRFLGDDHFHHYNLLNAGVSYDLSDQISLSADYQIGRDTPKFEFGTKMTVGLGVQF